MYNNIIKELLNKIEVLPVELLVRYLQARCSLSENLARQSIYAAARDRICCISEDGTIVAKQRGLAFDSKYRKKAAALAAIIQFLPDSADFICSKFPWVLTFLKGDKVVQVCYIENNYEIALSNIIKDIPVAEDDRPYYFRIGILENPEGFEKMKAVGFRHFCCVDDKYKVKGLVNVEKEDAWDDI